MNPIATGKRREPSLERLESRRADERNDDVVPFLAHDFDVVGDLQKGFRLESPLYGEPEKWAIVESADVSGCLGFGGLQALTKSPGP